MKFWMVWSTFVLFISTSLFAKPTTRSLVNELESKVYAISSDKVKGDNATQMLKDYILRIKDADQESVEFVNYPDAVAGADEAVNQHGLLSMSLFADLIISNKEEITKEEKAEVWEAVRALKAQEGVKFGYTGAGGSVCGVTWPSPLVIDTAKHVVYELILIGGGC